MIPLFSQLFWPYLIDINYIDVNRYENDAKAE